MDSVVLRIVISSVLDLKHMMSMYAVPKTIIILISLLFITLIE